MLQQLQEVSVLTYVECLIIYSAVGWLVESIYMSICNRKITNRGFAKLPLCPIYGFGAVLGYILLHSLSEHLLALYIVGAVIATVFEFFVGQLMIRFLHQLWWDYNEKPFNYKGIICLESTIAWGFYAIIIVRYLNGIVVSWANMIPRKFGIVMCTVVVFAYMFDFFYHVLDALDISLREYRTKIVENVREFRARW